MKIKCPACGFNNEGGAKFCSNCNEPLVKPKISINKENTNIKRILRKERLRMNKKQRVILAIFVPILLFFIALTVAYYTSVKIVITPSYSTLVTTSPNMRPEVAKVIKLFEDAAGYPGWQPGDPSHKYYPAVTHKYYDPYNWQKTWYVWFLFLAFWCFFEYKLFEDKEIISNKKDKNKIS